MILLEKLQWGYMYSYGDNNEIIFNNNPITQLTAKNGTGKSSIALIIQETLYNKNIKGIKKGEILNRYSQSDTWWSKLWFTDTKINNNYCITVQRKKATSKVNLFENNIDISEHKVLDTYKKVTEILGLDFEIFCQLTYQSSTDLLTFIKATDTQRKKFLINLFNLQEYISKGDTVKTKLIEAEKEATFKEGELKSINDFLEETMVGQKLEEKEVPESNEELQEEQRELTATLKDLETLNNKIDKNNLTRVERDKVSYDIRIKEPESFNSTQLLDFNKGITEYTTKIKANKDKIEQLDTAETCYVCGHDLDNSKNIELKEKADDENNNMLSEVSNLKILKKVEEEKQKTYNLNLEIYKKNQKNIEKFEHLSQLIDSSLPKVHQNSKTIQTRLQELHLEINKLRDIRDSIIKANESVKIHNNKVDTLSQQKREFLAKKEFTSTDLAVEKQKVKTRNILKKAYSTSGMVAFKLENLAKQLEATINSYLANLSDGQFQVIFRLTGEKLNIIIVSNGKESPIENASSGEFSRIQTALLLAIREILYKIGNNSINLLFLDEITGVLDEEGKIGLMEVLQEEQTLNVFLISHDFTHPMIDKIELLKEDNVTRILH
jgi:DNA repair exonuclease SbcCD ATPase subunit